MRKFNTSGPNIPEENYTLPRLGLIESGKKLVHNNRYFTIWAPRQTGKSTYFRLLADALREEGYKVALVDCKHFGDMSIQGFLDVFHSTLQESWGITISSDSIVTTFNKISTIKTPKLVLIIDGVDNINPSFLGNFLISIRVVFHSRSDHALKSVILGGVKNILGIVHNQGSSFNIADDFLFPYFRDAETAELLGLYELETGQLFDPSVKKRISAITANQPNLVNGLAEILVRNPNKKVITYADYLEAEELYVAEAIDENTLKTVNKLHKCRTLIERLLFTEAKIRFQITREDIQELYFEGILACDDEGYVMFRVPLYQKCLHLTFQPNAADAHHILSSINLDKKNTEGVEFSVANMITQYKTYIFNHRFKHFNGKDKSGSYCTLEEATLVYSFETYLTAFLSMVDGKTYIEAHTGVGRTDLIINVNEEEFVVEAKVYSDIVKFRRGKKQLAQYAKSLSLPSAIYLVFIESEITNENVIEGNEMEDGILIKTHLIPYNLDKDF